MQLPLQTCGIFPKLRERGGEPSGRVVPRRAQLRIGGEGRGEGGTGQVRGKGLHAQGPTGPVLEKHGVGTISRLALILKHKDGQVVKRRIVIDLKRLQGNTKSILPEKLARVKDAIGMV